MIQGNEPDPTQNQECPIPHEKLYGMEVEASNGIYRQTTVTFGHPVIPDSTHGHQSYTLLTRADAFNDTQFDDLCRIIESFAKPDFKIHIHNNENDPSEAEDIDEGLVRIHKTPRFLEARVQKTLSEQGNIPKGSIVIAQRSFENAPQRALSLHLNHPLDKRHEHLLRAWNGPVHEQVNAVKPMMEEYVEDFISSPKFGNIALSNTQREAGKLHILFNGLYDNMGRKMHIDLGTEGDIATDLFTYFHTSESILEENQTFVPHFYHRALLAIKKHVVNDDIEWNSGLFDSIDWEYLGEQIIDLGKGYNGILGGSAGSVDIKTFDMTIDPKTGKRLFSVSKEWKEMRAQGSKITNNFARDMQILVEGLRDFYPDIALVGSHSKIDSSSQYFCPVAPSYAIPEGGEHAFRIMNRLMFRLLKGYIDIKEAANAN